jgi:RNA recognition motif-containing protein
MGTKLYVTNLPKAASAHALRAHFGVCGVVADVHITPERNAGAGRDSAIVRMSSPAGAERARTELNGAPFGGRLLLIEVAPDDATDRRERASRKADPHDDARTRITLQVREPTNMACELDCSGVTVVVRVYFPDATGQWRVKVHASREANAPSSAATASSRLEAFRGVSSACREDVGTAAWARVDWEAIEAAMVKVRAL